MNAFQLPASPRTATAGSGSVPGAAWCAYAVVSPCNAVYVTIHTACGPSRSQRDSLLTARAPGPLTAPATHHKEAECAAEALLQQLIARKLLLVQIEEACDVGEQQRRAPRKEAAAAARVRKGKECCIVCADADPIMPAMPVTGTAPARRPMAMAITCRIQYTTLGKSGNSVCRETEHRGTLSALWPETVAAPRAVAGPVAEAPLRTLSKAAPRSNASDHDVGLPEVPALAPGIGEVGARRPRGRE